MRHLDPFPHASDEARESLIRLKIRLLFLMPTNLHHLRCVISKHNKKAWRWVSFSYSNAASQCSFVLMSKNCQNALNSIHLYKNSTIDITDAKFGCKISEHVNPNKYKPWSTWWLTKLSPCKNSSSTLLIEMELELLEEPCSWGEVPSLSSGSDPSWVSCWSSVG